MSTKPTRWLADRLGRRGAVLLILSLTFLFLGLYELAAPGANYDATMLHTRLPYPTGALLWIGPALVGLHAALQGGRHRDGYGYAALVVPVTFRVLSYIGATTLGFFGADTWPGAPIGAAVWTMVLALILTIAGWPEVDPPKPWRRRKGGGSAP